MRRAPLILAIVLCTSAAFAQSTDEGRSHFQRGVQFYKESDFRAALIEFKRAYESAPNFRVLYNLGQTSLELQDYAAALTAFRKYLDDGGKEIPRDRRAQVEAELKKLEGRVARVMIKTNLDGADVLVDDVAVAKTPLSSPILVSAGRRKIAIARPGGGQQSRTVDVAGGDETSVDLEIAVQQPVTAPPEGTKNSTPVIVTQPPPVAMTGGGPSTATWIGIVTTSALGVGAIVTGTLAVVSKSQFDEALDQSPGVSTKIVDAREKARTFALATDVLAGTAIAGAFVTVILALTTKGASKPVEAALHLDVGPTGAGFSGTF